MGVICTVILKQKIPFVMVTGCIVNGLKEEIQINSKNDFSKANNNYSIALY
jgi:hypothetical protein